VGDGITDRVEAIALPWFGRQMRVGTGLLAVPLFFVQVLGLPAVDPVTGVVPVVAAAVGAVAGAAAITTGLKVLGLAVRVPLSLHRDAGP